MYTLRISTLVLLVVLSLKSAFCVPNDSDDFFGFEKTMRAFSEVVESMEKRFNDSTYMCANLKGSDKLSIDSDHSHVKIGFKVDEGQVLNQENLSVKQHGSTVNVSLVFENEEVQLTIGETAVKMYVEEHAHREHKKGGHSYLNSSYSLMRSIDLVDISSVEAKVENSILSIILPKKNPTKTIDVLFK